ncbi:MAG: ribosome recycling factor [Candidatus Cloacimonadota bacterium]|nr:MAG: ribosome recycling factor [Candidatus Cloacimonadota bacterium]
MEETLLSLEEKMEKTFNALLANFSKLRTGRASAAVLDRIQIDYFGTPTPIKQLCNISIPEARMIVVKPWDKKVLSDVEKAILGANLGITPENDGNVIRLPFPALTEEKRKEIVKQIKKLAEDGKVAIRKIRRDGNDIAKKKKKASEITEDDEKRFNSDIQDSTDNWINKITESANNKEKEIMEV